MPETSAIFHDQVAGLFGFRLELGNDSSGVRMQARRSGLVTVKAAKVVYDRLCRQRDARHPITATERHRTDHLRRLVARP